jgi:signal transduction histidine kinase
LREIEAHLAKHGWWEGTLIHRRQDGTRVTVLSRWALRRSEGKPPIVLEINNDMTERKEAEEALKLADRRKSEFLATLAHELRNPLAPITNSLEIMRLAGKDQAVVEQGLARMDRQVKQMVRLVDDLMDVARINQGRITLRRERVDLAAVIDQSAELSGPLAEKLRHQVTVTLPSESIFLNADPIRLAQIFSNLLNNACKYTEPGGRIWLTAERVGSDARIFVADSGIGISAEMLPHIFEMFRQVDHTLERSQSGLGIGLTLVKQLVEMHDGTIEASSDGLGMGSQFVIRLPLLVETHGPGSTAMATVPRDDGRVMVPRRILVVDDSKDNADSLAQLLRITGHEARQAHDGLEAIEAAESFRPEIVLLDIGLPRLNGFEACRRIREHEWGKTMMLIALTGWGQEDDHCRSMDAGFDKHLVKPVDFAILMDMLASRR